MNLTLGWILRVSVRVWERKGKLEWEKERENERGRIRLRTQLVLFAVYRVRSLVGKWYCTTEPRLIFESSVSFALFKFGFGYLFFFLTNNLPNRMIMPTGQSVWHKISAKSFLLNSNFKAFASLRVQLWLNSVALNNEAKGQSVWQKSCQVLCLFS